MAERYLLAHIDILYNIYYIHPTPANPPTSHTTIDTRSSIITRHSSIPTFFTQTTCHILFKICCRELMRFQESGKNVCVLKVLWKILFLAHIYISIYIYTHTYIFKKDPQALWKKSCCNENFCWDISPYHLKTASSLLSSSSLMSASGPWDSECTQHGRNLRAIWVCQEKCSFPIQLQRGSGRNCNSGMHSDFIMIPRGLIWAPWWSSLAHCGCMTEHPLVGWQHRKEHTLVYNGIWQSSCWHDASTVQSSRWHGRVQGTWTTPYQKSSLHLLGRGLLQFVCSMLSFLRWLLWLHRLEDRSPRGFANGHVLGCSWRGTRVAPNPRGCWV